MKYVVCFVCRLMWGELSIWIILLGCIVKVDGDSVKVIIIRCNSVNVDYKI